MLTVVATTKNGLILAGWVEVKAITWRNSSMWVAPLDFPALSGYSLDLVVERSAISSDVAGRRARERGLTPGAQNLVLLFVRAITTETATPVLQCEEWLAGPFAEKFLNGLKLAFTKVDDSTEAETKKQEEEQT